MGKGLSGGLKHQGPPRHDIPQPTHLITCQSYPPCCMSHSRNIWLSRPFVMILHYNTTLTPSSKAVYSGTKYYDTHIEFHSLFLDVSSTDV